LLRKLKIHHPFPGLTTRENSRKSLKGKCRCQELEIATVTVALCTTCMRLYHKTSVLKHVKDKATGIHLLLNMKIGDMYNSFLFSSLERPQSEQSPVPETTPPQEEPEPLQGVMPPMNDNLPTLPPPKPALQVEEDESVLTNHTVYSPYQPSTSEEESVAPSLPPSHPTKTSDSPLQAPVQLPSPVPAMLPSAPAGVRPLIQPPVHIPGQVLPRPPIQEPVRPPTQISTGAAGPVPPRQPGLAPVRQPIRHTSQPGIRPVAVRMRSVTPQSATRPPMRHPIQPG